jgi:hypothetical protein
MSATAYTVVATFPSTTIRDEYIAWLQHGHLDEVIRGGAEAASIVVIDDPQSPIRVETRYTFRTRDAFDRYVQHHAPRLRAEGLKLFPPDRGVTFARTLGTFR